MDPCYTLLLFQSLCVSLCMTAKPAEDLSASSNKCPLEGCPAQDPGRKKSCPLACALPAPSCGHLCQHACRQVPDPALLPLRPLKPDLTPSGIYKDLFCKWELEMRLSAATDPTATSTCARQRWCFRGRGEGEAVQTFRPQELPKRRGGTIFTCWWGDKGSVGVRHRSS